MTENTENTIVAQFGHFKQLDYYGKLMFYNACFGIVPFVFPPFNSEVSWYSDRVKLSLLTNYYFSETRGKIPYEKYVESEGQKLTFSIKPVTFIQRIQHNKFIQQTFLLQKAEIENTFFTEWVNANYALQYVKLQVDIVNKSIAWVRDTVTHFKGKPQLPDQFLAVYYNGIKACREGKMSTVRCRRKFVELYLYSQGFLLADYLQFLHRVESIPKHILVEKQPVRFTV